MGAVATFNYQAWAPRYPEFCTVSAIQAQGYWDEATLYQRNDGTGPVSTVANQSTLLNMLTAHIAALNAPLNGQPSSPLVGRITSAAEGTVNVQTELDYPPGSAQWFAQTKYGAAWWAATVQYRTMRYQPGCIGPGYGPGARW